MTMPLVFPRSGGDAAGALAPNAASASAATAGHDGDAAASAQFGVALSLLLGHVAHPSGEAAETAATPAKAGETGVEGEATAATDEHEPLTPGAATLAHGAAVHSATPAHGDAGEATALLSHRSPSPVEVAADAAIDQATHQSLVAALASPMTIAPALVVVSPDELAAAGESTVHRDLGLLASEFRDRLHRVIERMESEFGYKVEVAETYRSQARQDALYAQGRTDPGAVVTWTRASNHTAGRAADVVIDGSYDNPEAYQRLMRIAREEGLRTLGPRDPGHLELIASTRSASPRDIVDPGARSASDLRASVIAQVAPSVASQSSIVPAAQELEQTAKIANVRPVALASEMVPATPAPVARVASVAAVAPVAVVAQVAAVATVNGQATPAVHATPRRTDASAARVTATRRPDADGQPASAAGNVATPLVQATATKSDGSSASTTSEQSLGAPNDQRRSRSEVDRVRAQDSATEVLRQTRDELMRAVASPEPTSASSSTTRELSGSGNVGHADMSERIARLLKVQDAASDRPLSQMMLRLERPDGGEDRLRVDLRGNTISATLDVSDPRAADRLTANVKELQQTLERHGFATDTVTIRTASRPMESSTLARAAGASVEADLQRTVSSSSTSNTNTSSRERGARHDEQRDAPDSQRQRSRREQKGGRS